MRSKVKKWSLMGLVLFAAFSLAACGSSGSSTTVLPPDGNGNGNGNGNGDLPPPAGLTVNDDTYAWLGNTAITVPSAIGVLANDVGVTTITTFQNPSTQGGTVSIVDLAAGGFTYEPPLAFTGTDTFTYTATDGTDQLTGTVTITINQEAWFVKNDFAGAPDGSSAAPFTTLAAASAASAAGDTIFVHTGVGTTGQTAGIDLLPNQRLIGEGVGLAFDVQPNGTPLTVPLTVIAPGAAPVIADTVNIINNLPVVTLAIGVEVAGIIVDGTGTLANMNGMSGAGITGFNIHDNTIRNVPRAGIELTGASGGTGMIVNNTLTDLIGPNPANAIDIVTTAAGVDFTIAGNALNTVVETGIRVQFPSGTVTVTDNNLTVVGTAPGSRGIDVDGAGTTTIAGNTVDNSGVGVQPVARSGIQVNATGPLAASVTGNSVLNAGAEAGEGGFEAQTNLATSTLCLQMTGNTTDSGFVLDNRSTGNVPANFRIEGPTQVAFEAANTGIFTYLLNPAAFSFVAAGTCGFAP